MKKTLVLFVAAAFMLSQAMPAAAQESGISEDSLQTSSRDSLQSSSDQSTAQSSANSDTSSADSSNDSSAQSSDQSSAGGGTSVLVIGGAVLAVGLTVGGIILTVNAARVKEEDVTRLQDQIYLAEGEEYDKLLAFFELDGRTVGRIHDELVASRGPIVSSQDAADFLALLTLRLAERSRRFRPSTAGA